MSPSDNEQQDATPEDDNGSERRSRPEPRESDAELGWIGDIVAQLENDPGECWLAMESLAAIDEDMRRAIIAELSEHRAQAGVRTLLQLLSAASDTGTRSAARLALPEVEGTSPAGFALGLEAIRGGSSLSGDATAPTSSVRPGAELKQSQRSETSTLAGLGIRIVRGLVTSVDGNGRATIVVSSSQVGQRRTAAFLCDVQKGILDVVGDVEPETPNAGRLVEEWISQTAGDCTCDVPELAVRLLGGCLLLCRTEVPGPIQDWLDGILGPGFQPSGLAGIVPDVDASRMPESEMAAHAHIVLDACPSWLDRSALTFELAEEICLREGLSTPDPYRDIGAFRYLFEHLLIHRLEMYRRMLLWMAWVWQGSGRSELSRSAFVLACQLSDEQYEVPSHPFTIALSTRSLEAAQDLLQTDADPRGSRQSQDS